MQAQTLNRALSTVSAAINPKSKLPILTHVLLENSPSGLRLVGSNLETTVVYQLPPNGNAATGGLTAPVEAFTKLAKTLKGAVALTLEPEALTTRLQAGELRLTLRGYKAADFLVVPERPTDAFPLATVDAAALQDALKRVQPVISTDESQPILNCVRLAVTADGARLTVQGANGHTLHTLDLALTEPATVTADVLVSLKQLQQLLKALAEGAAQTVRLYADPKREPAPEQTTVPPRFLFLEWDNADGAHVQARTRLTDGTYPDLNRVMPTAEPQQTSVVSVKALLDALKKLQLVEPTMVAIETQAEDPTSLELIAVTADATELSTRVPGTWAGAACGILVNPVYLEANLKAQPEDQVTLELRYQTLDDGTLDTCQPLTLRSGTLLAVTMPMHKGKGACRWQR